MNKNSPLPLNVYPLFWILIPVLLLLSPGVSRAVSGIETFPPVRLISPLPGNTVIGKHPRIECKVLIPFSRNDLLVMLDYVDITPLAERSGQGFSISPVKALSSGSHTLSVSIRGEDGVFSQYDFVFKSRQSSGFDEIYSNNQLTAMHEAALKKKQINNTVPWSRGVADLTSETGVKNGPWSTTVRIHPRYLDQNLPVSAPERKGVTLTDYLVEGRYDGGDAMAVLRVGDIRIDESRNTLQAVARRGGEVELKYEDFGLRAFVVNSGQVYGFTSAGKGTGIGSLDDHIIGAAVSGRAFNRFLGLKAVYLTGGSKGGAPGYWSADGPMEGDDLGLIVRMGRPESPAHAEAELDFSRFDADTSDEFARESDKAWRAGVNGYLPWADYRLEYNYAGAGYRVIGNEAVRKDRAGYEAGGGVNRGSHSLNLNWSDYHDNVDNDPLFPRTTTRTGGGSYSYSGLENTPISLGLSRTTSRSSREPAGAIPVNQVTDGVNASLGRMKGKLSLSLNAGVSSLDDRSSGNNDNRTSTMGLNGSYYSRDFSLSPGVSWNRMKDEKTGVITDTYTFNIDLRGKAMARRLSYDVAGTYNKSRADNGSADRRDFNSVFRLSYALGGNLKKYLNPSVGLRGQYNRSDDRIYGSKSEEVLIFSVLSISAPVSF